MFVVVFEFVPKPGKEAEFLAAWPRVTQGIYLLKGSLGSRLHRNEDGRLIAYAQWPSREAWEASQQTTMTPEYEEQRKHMLAALDLERTQTLFKLDVAIDYLQQRPFALE